jgi:formate hydrogenlyase subunit 3/multisubunit Na+/H+ antiporter MnhD subunit
VLLISSLLDVVYFFPIVYTAFFGYRERGKPNLEERKIKEAPMSMIIPLGITALFSIIFCFPNPITNVLLDLVRLAISR